MRKKEWGGYLWIDMEWIQRHNGKLGEKKGQGKRILIVCSPSCEKKGNILVHVSAQLYKRDVERNIETEENG